MGRFWFYIEYFNSHAHVERDGYIGSITRKLHNFNSHAHVERDNYPHAPCKIRNISTHTLTWSVTAEVSENSYIHMDFNSHAHVERDVKVYFISVIVWVFQLTRSRGAWPWRSGRSLRCYRHFNSHAHVERDYDSENVTSNTNISTHTLTWSVTSLNSIYSIPHYISTHTLTWSVTKRQANRQTTDKHFNSHAHVERDVLNVNTFWHIFISTHTLTWSVTTFTINGYRRTEFQLTRSRGAWLGRVLKCPDSMNISTHTLTWSVTAQAMAEQWGNEISTHTLTWSVTFTIPKREELKNISTHTLTWSVTLALADFATGWIISTHTLTWSVTVNDRLRRRRDVYFNSHAHVERDENDLKFVDTKINFNSHAHVERDG